MTITIDDNDASAIVKAQTPYGFKNDWRFGTPRIERRGSTIMTMGEVRLGETDHPALLRIDTPGTSEGVARIYQVTEVVYLADGVEITKSAYDDHDFFGEAKFRSLLPIGVSALQMTAQGYARLYMHVSAADLTVNIGDRDIHPADRKQIVADANERIDAMIARTAAALADGTLRYENAIVLDIDRREAGGTVRYGGKPDMAEGQEWPLDAAGQPLDFVAQIDLAGFSSLAATELPANGLLSIFYDLRERPWGHEPEHQPSLRVLHVAGDASPRDLPAGIDAIEPLGLTAKGIVVSPGLTAYLASDFAILEAQALIDGDGEISDAAHEAIADKMRACGIATYDMATPDHDDIDEESMYGALGVDAAPEGYDCAPDLSKIDPNDDEAMARAMDAADAFHNEMDGFEGLIFEPSTRLITIGGPADPIQGEMEEQAHAMSQRLHGAHASASAADWVHLLTLHEGGVNDFYDDGRVYLWIMKTDLAVGDFSRVVYQLQCF